MKLPSKDIHCHILPGVDDGFQSAEDSSKALKTFVDNGCREVVFTPHMNPDVYPDSDEAKLRSAFEGFKSSVPEGIDVSLAAEYMVVDGFENRAGDESLLTWPDKTILIEMSYMYDSPNLEQTIFNFVMEGYQPVLAHPERYVFLQNKSGRRLLSKYCEMGCRLQMNLLSATGAYGKGSLETMEFLLENDLYSFAASDLHSLEQLSRILSLGVHPKIQKRFRKSRFAELM